MSLFNTSLSTRLLYAVQNAGQQQQMALLRLSTGLRINQASDDPAGLIALTGLQAQAAMLDAANANAERADALLSTADGSLAEVSDLLTEMNGLAVEAASDGGLSDDEIEAIQLQIDASISSIDRILGNTEFNDKLLFGGSLSYTTSGVDAADIRDLAVYAASPLADSTNVTIEVNDSAELAQLAFSGAGLASGNDVELQIAGNAGTEVLSLAGSSTIAEIASAVNANTGATGVSAVASAGHVYFYSTQYGDDQFASVEALEGDFDLPGGVTTDYGADASVTVNGAAASVDGLHVRAAAGSLSVAFDLTESFNQATGGTSFAVTGGGATFSVGDGAAGLVEVGLPQLSTGRLGNASLGYLSSLATGGAHAMANDPAGAQAIIEAASRQVSTLRSQLGATQTFVIGAAANNVESMIEATAGAISDIADADYAETVADLVRSQLLGAAAINGLAVLHQNAGLLLGLLMN